MCPDCSRLGIFATRPHSNIIAASHTAELAETNSAHVQRYIRDNADVLDYGLRNDSKGNWETTNDCRYRAISVGGAVTGFRADLVIIDDPLRGRLEAESALSRANLWDWFTADLLTRLKPHGAVVLILTPYHEDDLAGRLLRRPPEGAVFKPSEMRVLDVPPPKVWQTVRAWIRRRATSARCRAIGSNASGCLVRRRCVRTVWLHRWNIGAVSMLRAPWNAALIDELASFPLGQYDDMVDALSLGFSKVTQRVAIRISEEALRRSAAKPQPRAFF